MAIDQLDQRDISADLRMMDDRALQQYAAMHKNDPYVFPLAFQESQNRQRLRASKSAQAAGQVAPKTNDAALMAMTPQTVTTGSGGTLQTEYGGPVRTGASEAQGISRLAAPNIERMADGGIAGYEDDEEGMATGGMGGMFNFAQQSEPVIRMSGGGVPGYRGPTDGEDSNQVTDEFAGVDDQIAANMERQKMMGAFDDYSKYTPTPKKGSKAAKKLEEEAKKEDTAKKPALPALPTYTPKTAEEIKASSDLMAKPELEKIQSNYKPFAEQFAQDRARIEGREKNAVSDMLIRGGLKAMAGKSQFAMQNLGEGGLEALNAYQEGQKANEASRRALTQSEMLMGQAQRAEERGAKGEAVSLFAQADKSQQASIQFGQKAEEIKNSKAYQDGSLLVAQQNAVTQGRMADASMVSALASQSRANALNAAGGAKGAMTEAQLARARDTARDNITKDDNYAWDKLQAQRAAEKSGKVFNADAWLAARVQQEVDRLLANTSRGAKIDTSAAPTGGKLGSGTSNLDLWKDPIVVTPK
jgi:hypothetical protein